MPQGAYVWQRHWTPALEAAIGQAEDLVDAWHVLAAEIRNGAAAPVAADLQRLAASSRPVVPVFRIEGRLERRDHARVVTRVVEIADAWRRAGLDPKTIEIDYDSPTAHLADYADFLDRLRQAAPPGTAITITALPTWLDSSALDAVLARVDEPVLQVHGVDNPRHRLFDPALARTWVDAFAVRSPKPFRVALPAYGSRVVWNADFQMVAVESETPMLAGGTAVTLTVPPNEVADFLAELRRDRPAHLAGIVWFRLPTADDRQAWSLPSWRAVASGRPITLRLHAVASPAETPGMLDLALVNDGEVDVSLPRRILLPSSCGLADGVNGYGLSAAPGGKALDRLRDGLLPVHARRIIGWARCDAQIGELDVDP